MKVKWNTGCHYTPRGQIIIATIADDGSVLFNDTSRMISGTMGEMDTTNKLLLDNTETDNGKKNFLREYVMHRYLQNKYQWDPRADSLKE